MFGFGKRQSKADAAVAVLGDAIVLASERWQFVCDKVPYRADVELVDQISAFTVPFYEGARKTFPALRDAPDCLLLLVVAQGVERSGTHSRAEVEQALGVRLPD